MIWFILGLICGGFIGVFVMCLLNASRDNEEISTKE